MGAYLEKLNVNLGKIFTIGATINPRLKHISPHFVRDTYVQKLMWIEKENVVLWDEKTKRGWLVDGTSALLHLVRMSLKLYAKGNYSNELLFNESKMRNATNHEPESAAQVLGDRGNRKLEVWPGKSERWKEEEGKGQEVKTSEKRKRASYSFENLVEQKHTALEFLIESHRQFASMNGINMKFRIRKHLEGWDFEDLAGENDPELRVATLKAVGYGWADFIHSIKAITLFGCGFGDIIVPSKAEKLCPQWSQLPKGQYNLAASMFDLNNIVKRFGQTHHERIEVVHGLLWHSPTNPFAPCHCHSHKDSRDSHEPYIEHHSPVQVLFPKIVSRISRARKPEDLNNSGAIIFGHTMSWGSDFVVGVTNDISTEMSLHPCPANPQEAALESNIPETSLPLNHHSSEHFKGTYGDAAHPFRSAITALTAPEETASRHVSNLLGKRRNHVDDYSDEEMDDDDDNWQKMWWETDYPSRYVPARQAAAENLGAYTHTYTVPRSPPCPPPTEDCQYMRTQGSSSSQSTTIVRDQVTTSGHVRRRT